MIFLGLGSNMGEKAQNLRDAMAMLEENGVSILRTSPFYQSKAWGNTQQNDFVNAVVEVFYEGNARKLLEVVLSVENQLGRIREEKWGPRLIDIDILEFHREAIGEPGLRIPHPWYPKRIFVVLPMSDLEPDWIPTGGKLSLTQLVSSLGHDGLEKLTDFHDPE